MPARLLTDRYVVALSLVAGLTILGQLLVQRQLSNQENDAWLVNYAGRQRFQSQAISKNALLLAAAPSPVDTARVRGELARMLTDWEQHHAQLRTGNLTDLNTHTANSTVIQAMFGQIRPHFDAIRTATCYMLTAPNTTPASRQQAVRAVLAHEGLFLAQMDRIVAQYERESRQKIVALRTTERLLMLGTLLVLLLEAMLIFRPVAKTLQTIFGQLTVARQQAEDTNARLLETQRQLLRESVLRHQQQLGEERIRMASLVQGQEDERRRLSRDLHDGIGQMLTGLKLLTENLRSIHLLPANEQRTHAALTDLVLKIIRETRHVANNLMPPVLSDFGLEPALRYVAEQAMQQSGMAIRVLSWGAGGRLDPAVEIGLYRIAQEALTNAIKHAGAAAVDIELRVRKNRLLLSITDDGCGVGAAPSESVLTGQGLHNMRQRTRLMDGVLRLISQPGQGTRIVVVIPLTGAVVRQMPVPKKKKQVSKT